jgi:hypothetical protein
MEAEFPFRWGSQKLEPKIGIPNLAWKWFSDTYEIMIYVFHINTDDNENGWFPPSNSSGKIMSMQGDGQVILKIQSLHMTK